MNAIEDTPMTERSSEQEPDTPTVKRNLSGVFFRYQVDGKWDNVCFEDLPEAEQRRIIAEKPKDFVSELAIILGKALREIGDTFGVEKV